MGQVLKRYRKLPKSPLFGLITALVVLSMSIVTGLRVDANPLPIKKLPGGMLTVSQTLNPNYVYVVDANVIVPSGVTLTIPAGTIVKYKYYGSITIRTGGLLRVTGTAASPVHFTSFKDDTVAGDTNDNSDLNSPAIDDFQRAIVSEDGEANIVFAEFRYMSKGIEGTRTSGSIVVTDSTFDNSHIAINVKAPTVKLYRNKFNNLTPYSLDGAVQIGGVQDLTKISLSGIDQNVFTGTNKFSRIIRLTKTVLPIGKTWAPASTSGATINFFDQNDINGTATLGTNTSMIIPATAPGSVNINGTLNIQSGVWIKFPGWSGNLFIKAGGKISVVGTAANPVRFTSFKDDTVGGDTNGDGNLTAPTINDFSSAFFSEDGDVSIQHAQFAYFSNALAIQGGTVDISDSTFDNGEKAIGIFQSSEVVLKRNKFNLNPGVYHSLAVSLYEIDDVSGVVLSGADRNIFSGDQRGRILSLYHVDLPADKIFNVDANSGVLVAFESEVNIHGTLNLNQGTVSTVSGPLSWTTSINVYGTMNIFEGSVVKFNNIQGIGVFEGANLNVYGTAANAVQFTSFKDDTVGGDTNSDSSQTLPSIDDTGNMIALAGGNAYIINTAFNYAPNIINGGTQGSLKVFDSSFKNTLRAISGEVANVKIYRNEFNTSPSEHVRGAIELGNVQDISRIGLSGSDQNFFTGASKASRLVYLYSSKLPSDRSLVVSQTSGGFLHFYTNNDIYGNLTMGTGTVLAAEGHRWWYSVLNIYGTLTLQQGSIVKSIDHAGISIKSGGKVSAMGTSLNKVKITHLYDDLIGGDTNGDGANTSPSSGGYHAFVLDQGAVLDAHNVDVTFANIVVHQGGGRATIDGMSISNSTAFAQINDGEMTATNMSIQESRYVMNIYAGAAILRGSISTLQDYAIQACKWGTQNCSVDAAYVDWGTGGAPATGTVCGQVTVSPWVGGSSSGDGLFTSKNCDNSPTPADQLASSTQHFGQRMSVRGIDCGNGFEDACEAMRRARTCLNGAVSVAGSTSPFPLPGSEPHEQVTTWGQSLADGATTYIQAIESPTPQLSALQFGSKLLGALNTMVSIGGAYASCAP